MRELRRCNDAAHFVLSFLDERAFVIRRARSALLSRAVAEKIELHSC